MTVRKKLKGYIFCVVCIYNNIFITIKFMSRDCLFNNVCTLEVNSKHKEVAYAESIFLIDLNRPSNCILNS